MTDRARRLQADWRAAPVPVKAFVLAPVVGLATEWAYNAHVRARPGAFVIAAVIAALFIVALIRRHRWAWTAFALVWLADVTGVLDFRHPVHRPLAVAIALDVFAGLLLFSPPMLRWVGISRRWRTRTGGAV